MAITPLDLTDCASHEGNVLVHFPSQETGMLDSPARCTPRRRPLGGSVMSEAFVPVFRANAKYPSPVKRSRR